MTAVTSARATPPVHVAYYLWRFPALSETFIQREVRALIAAGLHVDVLAEGFEDEELWDAGARALASTAHYVQPMRPGRMGRFVLRFLRQDVRLFFHLLRYTLANVHHPHKSLPADLRLFLRAVWLAGWLQEMKITHLHSPWANTSAFIAHLAARLAGISFSLEARASADLYRTTARYGLREKFKHARFIITNCQFNRAFIASYLPPGAETRVHVIYEGLELERFAPPARHTPAGGPVQLLTVARLIEEKGLVYLLQALRLLKDRGRVFRCEIVGGAQGPESARRHQDLLALAESLELGDVLSFTGALPFDQVMAKYAGADIFVLPSVIAGSGGRDVTPNVLIEAMAMKRAVVATHMTGIPELVEDGVSGILVPPRNAPALALALARLIDSPALRGDLGEQARRRVEQRFDLNKNVHQYLALFEGR